MDILGIIQSHNHTTSLDYFEDKMRHFTESTGWHSKILDIAVVPTSDACACG